jgi:hypothetical protein
MKKLIIAGVFIFIIIIFVKIISDNKNTYYSQVNDFTEILLKNGEITVGVIENVQQRNSKINIEAFIYEYKFSIEGNEYFGKITSSRYMVKLIKNPYFKMNDELTILYSIENPQTHSVLAINGNRISNIVKTNAPSFHISPLIGVNIEDGIPSDSLFYEKYYKQ